MQSFPFEGYSARVWRIDADQTFHQRRFARTVFAHQRMHRTLAGAELDVAEGSDTWELLGDTLHMEHVFVFHSWLLLCSMTTVFPAQVDSGQSRSHFMNDL